MSLFIKKKNIVFIHIPKTGGTSVGAWIKRKLRDQDIHREYNLHSTIYDIRKHTKENWDHFTVVRNPYARTLSWFEYQHRKALERIEKDGYINDYNQKIIDVYNLGFNKSIDMLPKVFYDDVFLKPQTDYYDNKCKFLFRTETLNLDFVKIQNWFNVHEPLENRNTTKKLNYQDVINAKSKKVIEKLFEKDLDILKYTF